MWGDLGVILRQAPRSSAFIRAYDPEAHEWGLLEQLMALTADQLAVSNWQRGAGKQKDFPKPIPRPGVESDKKFGKEAIEIDEMAEWLGWEQK